MHFIEETAEAQWLLTPKIGTRSLAFSISVTGEGGTLWGRLLQVQQRRSMNLCVLWCGELLVVPGLRARKVLWLSALLFVKSSLPGLVLAANHGVLLAVFQQRGEHCHQQLTVSLSKRLHGSIETSISRGPQCRKHRLRTGLHSESWVSSRT